MTSSQLLGLQVNVAMPIFFDVHVRGSSSGLHAYAVSILPTQPSPRLSHVNSNPELESDYGFITDSYSAWRSLVLTVCVHPTNEDVAGTVHVILQPLSTLPSL